MPYLASGFGPGGGLYLQAETSWDRIDELPTVGMAVSPAGDRLARVLFGVHPDADSHLLMYDAAGVLWYRRLSALLDPHGIVWVDADTIVVIGTLTNTALWISAGDGHIRRERRFAQDPDAWHLNTPALDLQGRLVCTEFGIAEGPRGWNKVQAPDGPGGGLFDLEDERVLFDGLSLPHDPLPRGDRWLVNNSARNELVEVDATGRISRRVAVGGWSRGLLTRPDGQLLVGVSAERGLQPHGYASIVEIDGASFTVVRRWPLACEEVFSIVEVNDALLAGLRAGFSTVPGVVDLTAPPTGADTVMDAPLEPLAFRVAVQADAEPGPLEPGQSVRLSLTVQNLGDVPVSSTGALPVIIGGRWVSPAEIAWSNEPRASLRSALLPGHRARLQLDLTAPEMPGTWTLHLGAVQERVAWANDLHPELDCALAITVRQG